MIDKPQTELNILIVDDEPLARNRLVTLCKRINNTGEVGIATGGRQAMEIIAATKPDVLLLDVDMPDISGMEVAQSCQSLGHIPEIIFTTAHSKYAVQAFRLEATDYLLKPVKQALLVEALERAAVRLGTDSNSEQSVHEKSIWVRGNTGSVQIKCEDIGWIGAERDYMRINLLGRSYLVHESMRSLAERLPDNMFVRVHRSTLVQKNHIRDYRRRGRRNYLVLNDGTELTVGPSYAGGLGLSETDTE